MPNLLSRLRGLRPALTRRAFPDRAKALFEKNQEAAEARYTHLTKLVDLYK